MSKTVSLLASFELSHFAQNSYFCRCNSLTVNSQLVFTLWRLHGRALQGHITLIALWYHRMLWKIWTDVHIGQSQRTQTRVTDGVKTEAEDKKVRACWERGSRGVTWWKEVKMPEGWKRSERAEGRKWKETTEDYCLWCKQILIWSHQQNTPKTRVQTMGKTTPGGNRAPEVELKKYLYEVLYVSRIFRYLYLGFYFFDDFLLLIYAFLLHKYLYSKQASFFKFIVFHVTMCL